MTERAKRGLVRERLKCFGAGAVNGFRVARNRSRAGLDDSELQRVLSEARTGGFSRPTEALIAAYGAGFRVGWLSGWGT